MRYGILALALLASGCSSILMPTAEQLATAISKSSINVSKGEELPCTAVTHHGHDIEIHRSSDAREAWRACQSGQFGNGCLVFRIH